MIWPGKEFHLNLEKRTSWVKSLSLPLCVCVCVCMCVYASVCTQKSLCRYMKRFCKGQGTACCAQGTPHWLEWLVHQVQEWG